MTKVRNNLIGLVVSAVVTGIIVSCGGGGGGGYGGGMGGYVVGGTLSGATGSVVLKLNGGSDMTVPNGPFAFATMVDYLSTYNVQVVDANDRCTVTGGAGTMGLANVTNVSVSCGTQTTQKVIRTASLGGAQEVPANAAMGTGVGGVIVDPADNSITGGITFSGLTAVPTDAGIYLAAPGANAVSSFITLVLAADNATATIPAGTILTAPQFTALLAGNLYFNVKTTMNPNGEIRGQIDAQGGVLAGRSNMDGTQEVPASTSTATGTGTLLVDAATHVILISYMTDDVSNVTMAHIHTSPTGPGSNGNFIVAFTLGTNLAYAPARTQMAAQNITDLLANHLYFDVHSTNNFCAPAADCSLGEIRGNISVIP